MRVSITYSVDMEEVTQVVANLLKEISAKFDTSGKSFDNIFNYVDEENVQKACEQINKLRESLGSIDMSLADCQHILNGYQKARMESEVEDAPTSG